MVEGEGFQRPSRVMDGVGYNFRGTFSLVLAAKLKALKSDLKSWNKRFGNASIRKKLAFNETGFGKEMEGGSFPLRRLMQEG